MRKARNADEAYPDNRLCDQQGNIITREVHAQSNICMVCRIIIHQRNKQTNDVNQSE